MPYSIAQNSFTGGVFAPSLYGRPDLEKYPTALRTLRNFIIHPHGPASNRGGLEYTGETKDSSKESRLIPFIFSVVQAYMLEFGDQYIRVIKDGGYVYYDPGNATDIRNATYKWTASASGTGEYYLELAAGGDPGLDEPGYVYEDPAGTVVILGEGTLGSLAAGEWGYGDNDTLGYDTIYVRLSDSTDPDTKATGFVEASYKVEIASPYTEDDLSLIKYTQSADVLYLDHPSYPPRKLSRTAHDTWTLTTITWGASIAAPGSFARSSGSGTGKEFAVTAVTEDGEESVISTSAAGGTGDTFTWASVTGAASYNFYEKQNGVYGYVGNAVGTTYVVPSSISADFDVAPPTANDPFNTTDLYPGVPTFFEQRLLHARSNTYPDKLWGSVIGSFENLNKSSPLQDDDGYAFVLNSQQVNEIRWMVPLQELIIGTSGSEWRAKSGEGSNTITPSSIDMKVQSHYGSADILPLVIGNNILFIQRGGKVVRDFGYSLEIDGYNGNDLSILANHLFSTYAIKEWAFQQKPDSIVWCVREDGALLGFTYQREHQVWGWHTHDTDGYFESVASIPTDSGDDEVYFVIRRTINGATKRYVERFRTRLPSTDIMDAFFVDCGLTYDVPVDITGATNDNPVQITAPNHGFSNGDLVDIVDVVGMTDLNVNRYKVKSATTNTFEITDEDDNDIDGAGFDAYVSGGTVRKAVTTLTGFDHLEGETLAILANGSEVTRKVVTNGAITLTNPASRVHGGLGFISDLETLDFHFQLKDGTTQDRLRNLASAVMNLKDTRAMWIGPNADRLVEVAFREDEDYGDPTEMFSGEKEQMLEAGPERQSRIFIRNTAPLPVTVLSLIARYEYGEN